MATVYSVQKTKWSQNVPSEFIKTTELSGRVRIAFAEYEASSLAIGDVIQFFNLPNGARIIDGYLANDALGASTTLSIGNAAYVNAAGTAVAASATSFLAATSTTSEARTDAFAVISKGSGSLVDADKDGLPITATLAGAAATGTIYLSVRYVVD